MAYEDHWLPGFNFNVEEMGREGQHLGDARDLPHARPGSRGVRGCDRGEARQPVHDPQPHARGEAAPGGGLVRTMRSIGSIITRRTSFRLREVFCLMGKAIPSRRCF